MESVFYVEKTKKRRIRKAPNRKWQLTEESSLMEFLKNNKFEKPTAQIFYKKFLRESEITADWNVVRAKVRNMRICYNKAKAWESSTEAGTLNEGETVRDVLLRMCSYFDDFDEIFHCRNLKTSPALKSLVDGPTRVPSEDILNSTLTSDKVNEDSDISSDWTPGLQPKKKRMRKTPNRKWQLTEEASLMEFLKNNKFEKPTSEIFYKKFLGESEIIADWNVVRAKVRNMRICYNKAKAWESSTEAGTLNEGETVRDVLLRMCSYFDDFDEIFQCWNLKTSTALESLEDDPIFVPSEDILNSTLTSNEIVNEDSDISSDCCTSTSRKGKYSVTAVSDIIDLQNALISLKKQKMEQDKEFKARELAIFKEKFLFEKEKVKRELDIRETEIKIQQRLKIAELEMQERIAMRELEMKERIALKELEKK